MVTDYTLGFSSMGAPALSLPEIDLLAQRFHMDFVELRALGGEINLPAYFAHEELHSKTPVRVWATSLHLLSYTKEDLVEFYEGAALAGRLGVPYLRVMGSRQPLTAEQLPEAAKFVREIRAELARRGCSCELLLETHDVFDSSPACVALNGFLTDPLLILWDSFHTWRDGGESPEASWKALGKWVRHIHYKDCDATGRYVFPGDGIYPTSQLLELLRRENYAGGVSLEWEKLWHPELAELTGALAKFCRLLEAV